MIGQVFHVVTEFRFEVGSALLGTEKLQSAVEGVSSAADDALLSFQKMGIGLVAQMGLGAGGVLGILGKSIQSFDKFKQSQLALTNVMGSGAGSFEERMASSAEMMERMSQIAGKFALPVDDLISMTKLMAPMLAAHTNAKGESLAGPGFSTAISMSRSLLKSAPVLGIDPGLVQQQLLRAIEGQASMGDTLFGRLVADTPAMAPFKEKGSKAFNAMDITKRVATLNAALNTFSSDAKVLDATVHSLSGQFRLLQNSLTSSMSILRPLGATLTEIVVRAMETINKMLMGPLKEVFVQLGRAIGPNLRNPEQLIATLMQLKDLGSSVRSAEKVLAIAGGIVGAAAAMAFFSIQIPFLTSGLAMAARAITFLTMPLKGLSLGLGVGGIFNSITILISGIIAPLLLLVGVFQLLSRAFAIAKIRDMKHLVELSPRVAEAGATLARIFDVFNEGFGKMAELIAPFLSMSSLMDFLVDILETATMWIGSFLGAFQGLVFMIMETVNQFQSLFSGGGFSMSAIGDAWTAGVDMMMERILGGAERGDASLSSPVTNIAKIEIRNEFKEQQEPDRIAFSLKDQLLKAAQNPTQRRGGSMQAATVGR